MNHKRVYRLYRQEGLSLRLKTRKKRVSGLRPLKVEAQAPNEHLSMDFMSDRLADGRRFRVLTLVDNFSRVSPALEADSSLTGDRVVQVLERVAMQQGAYPKVISVDNGPEFVSKALDAWAHRNGVKLLFSRLGTPMDNAYVESFNGRLRDECLNQHWFASLTEARQVLESWRIEYNTERPHSSLGDRTPAENLARLYASNTSKYDQNEGLSILNKEAG